MTPNDRYIRTLTRAIGGPTTLAKPEAVKRFREIRAVVRAVTPGRQQAKNLRPLLDVAVKAAARVIRTRR